MGLHIFSKPYEGSFDRPIARNPRHPTPIHVLRLPLFDFVDFVDFDFVEFLFLLFLFVDFLRLFL